MPFAANGAIWRVKFDVTLRSLGNWLFTSIDVSIKASVL